MLRRFINYRRKTPPSTVVQLSFPGYNREKSRSRRAYGGKKIEDVMAEHFDPYHRWLGIPPKDQPPNHYRLLGIEKFEDHADVIAEAADRQMAHVRTHQAGPRVKFSQQLLNEIAEAKLCLLKPAMKAAYDANLRAAEATKPIQPTVPAPAPTLTPPARQPVEPAVVSKPAVPSRLDVIVETPADYVARRPASRRRPPTWQLPAIVGGVVCLVVVVGVLAGIMSRPSTNVAQNGDAAHLREKEPSVNHRQPGYAASSGETGSVRTSGDLPDSQPPVSPGPVPSQNPPVKSDNGVDIVPPPSEPENDVVITTAEPDLAVPVELPELPAVPDEPARPSVTSPANQFDKEIAWAPELKREEIDALVKTVDRGLVTINMASGKSATGFLVDPRGYVATSYAAVRGSRSAEAVFLRGQRVAVRGFVAADPARDLAILSIDPDGLDFTALRSARIMPQPGDQIAALGISNNTRLTCTDNGFVGEVKGSDVRAYIMAVIDEDLFAERGWDEEADWVQTNIQFDEIYIGGPLCNRHGEVIGLCVWGTRAHRRANFAIAASEIRRLLQSSRGQIKSLDGLAAE